MDAPIKKRLVADRFRRVWAVTQEIATNPGRSRAELALIFSLSERQLQSDLNIVRRDMRLPLIRRSGYRFVSEGGADGAGGAVDIREAQLLVLLVQQARRHRSGLSGLVESLAAKLPTMFPPHIAPLMTKLMDAAARPGREQQVFSTLADAALSGAWVRLHYPPGSVAEWEEREPVVRPELLLPYLSGWFVLGEGQSDGRSRMWNLDRVTAVTQSAVDADARRLAQRGAGY